MGEKGDIDNFWYVYRSANVRIAPSDRPFHTNRSSPFDTKLVMVPVPGIFINNGYIHKLLRIFL